MTETPAPYHARRLPTALVCERASKVKLVCFDVDGTLTDGRIGYAGTERVLFFHTHDGHGIHSLADVGIPVAWITANRSLCVADRAHALKVRHLYQGRADKDQALLTIMEEARVKPDEIAYLGDDRNDVNAMLMVGLAAAVANAMPAAIAAAHYVTERDGGKGAARELCDLILAAQGK